MAQGRYSRIDGQNSSNCCLIVTITVFVSSCLLGAWMTMSSSGDPARSGVTLDLFIGDMPKVGGGSEANVPENTLKVNIEESNSEDTSPIMSGNGPVSPKKSESVKEVAEGSVSVSVSRDGDQLSRDEHVTRNNGGANPGPKESPAKMKQSEKVDLEQNNGPEGEFKDNLPGSRPNQHISNETHPQAVPLPTQSTEPKKEKVLQKVPSLKHQSSYRWKVCNVTAGPDYIPCLDNIKAIKHLHGISHYEHMERHCPDEAPTCLVSLPEGYRTSIRWPKSRDMIWYKNVPHTRLAQYKKDQNWVRVSGRYTTFPGGGTQFKHGALHYIDFIQKTLPDIAWGKRSRVILDVGCGVASFGGYLFERDVLTMSLAPKDVHEAQVQFALERGIPAILAVMGSKRLPFPSMVFDVIHCARCRVPWHLEGGRLLLELDRVLRPGGYFVWSATPVYRRDAENVGIWKDMSRLTKSMCWELVKVGKDDLNGVSAAIFQKPTSNDCYERRAKNNPPLCEKSDDPNLVWYRPLMPCIHRVPTDPSVRGSQWPAPWPSRLEKSPYWLKSSEVKASFDFSGDYNHWKRVMADTYLNGIGVDWSIVRNVMDMKASYGGFAAALKDLKLWVMNVIPVNSTDTLPVIYERGLIGLYHDWCESFNTYPRSYDLLHADRLFSDIKNRCNFVVVMTEVDRILRPGGKLIVRDDRETIFKVESIGKSLHWKVRYIHTKETEALICIEKTFWRPSESETIVASIA